MNTTGPHQVQRNRFDICLTADDEPFLFRTGCFLKHPESTVVAPHKFRLTLSRASKDLFFFFRVDEGSGTIATPYPDAFIHLIPITAGSRFIVRLDHVLGFSETMFFNRAWRIDTISMLTLQFRYIYFEGPGRLLVFGLGETSLEEIDGQSAHYDQGCVIGWDNELAHGISSRSSGWSAFWSLEDLILDYFEGAGRVLTQSSTMRKLPRHFRSRHGGSSAIDKLNAILGLRI